VTDLTEGVDKLVTAFAWFIATGIVAGLWLRLVLWVLGL